MNAVVFGSVVVVWKHKKLEYRERTRKSQKTQVSSKCYNERIIENTLKDNLSIDSFKLHFVNDPKYFNLTVISVYKLYQVDQLFWTAAFILKTFKLSFTNTFKHCTKKKFSMKDFFSKRDQIRRLFRIWSYLLKKFFMENIIFLCSEEVKVAVN